jgi:membrane-associated phospholipid phosphatase
MSELAKSWKTEFASKNFRIRASITILFLAVSLYIITAFLPYNELRPGFSMVDPLLSLFKPVDVTWFTFILIYGGLIIALVSLCFHPEEFMLALQSYTLVLFLRFSTIYFLPLNAPEGIIPLKDPFVEFFGGGQTLLRDLFFSGHTATMFLFFLTSPIKKLKWIFLVCTVLVAAAVLIQHVHYTIDVIAAPVFAYTCYRIAYIVDARIKKLI